MDFEKAIRAEYATMHLMKEWCLTGPIEPYLSIGYSLELNNRPKWDAIQKEYELEIARCLKQGHGDRKGFKFRKLAERFK